MSLASGQDKVDGAVLATGLPLESIRLASGDDLIADRLDQGVEARSLGNNGASEGEDGGKRVLHCC